jgi:hypothetical protein
MKTAYEESRTAIFDIARRSGILRAEFEREITRIQLDAAKRGMELAAEVLSEKVLNCPSFDSKIMCDDCMTCTTMKVEILEAASTLTIEQLNK